VFGRRKPVAAPPPPRQDWRSFDAVAEAYGRVRAPVHALPAADLVEALEPPSGSLLDVGAGTGVASAAAREAGWRPVVAVDRSIPMLRLAGAGIGRVGADVVDLPFRDGRFDAVMAVFSLHVFPRYDTALFDMLRVLRPGGRFASATWASGDDEFGRTWRSVAESYATKALLADAQRRAAPWQERFSDPTRLDESLRDAGIRDLRIERRGYRRTTAIDEYLAGRETTALGRFLHGVLGDDLWERFRVRVEEEFRSRFPDPLGDSYEALLAVGTKPVG
jgi:ubiquinone/menaquinone biosynthesis C-methylase UbiE